MKALIDTNIIIDALQTRNGFFDDAQNVLIAAANGEYKGLNRADLVVEECYTGAGPTLKRLDIRARGRANRLLKRTCHITIILGNAKA